MNDLVGFGIVPANSDGELVCGKLNYGSIVVKDVESLTELCSEVGWKQKSRMLRSDQTNWLVHWLRVVYTNQVEVFMLDSTH